MKVKRVSIDSISQDPANVRMHDERNLAAIAGSLRRFGQQTPIVIDKANVIRKGNGTYEAAKSLGWSHLDVVQTELEGADAVAYAIADNKTSDLSEFNFQGLAAQLRSLDGDLQLATGFADYELEPLLQAVWEPPAVDEGGVDSTESGDEIAKLEFTAEQWSIITARCGPLVEGGQAADYAAALTMLCAQ